MCNLLVVANDRDRPEQTLIGRNLERLLRKHGPPGAPMTHRALAEKTGGVVSHVDVGRIKSGETPDPSGNKLRAIAEALGEDISTFWADPESAEHMDPTIKAVAEMYKLDEQDLIDLSSSRWRLSGAPPEKVFHVLQIIRIERGGTQ